MNLVPTETHPSGMDPTANLVHWEGHPRKGQVAITGGIYSVKGGYLMTFGGLAELELFPDLDSARATFDELVRKARELSATTTTVQEAMERR